MISNMSRVLIKCASSVGITERMFRKSLSRPHSNHLCLLYHEVTGDQLAEHVQFLNRHFDFITIEELMDAIDNERVASKPKVVLSFDDGLLSFHSQALAILEKFGIPAIVYVTTGILESELWTSPDSSYVVAKKSDRCTTSRIYPAEVPSSSSEAVRRGFRVQKGMTVSALIEADRNSLIEIGGHTVTHPDLPLIADEVAAQEITYCKNQLERILNHPVRHFAFPRGMHSRRDEKLVAEAGFISAAAVDDCWIDSKCHRFAFSRKGTGPKESSVAWLQYRIGK